MSATFELQDADDKAGTFKGFASVFNTPIDTWCPTVIRPGAFTKTLADTAQRARMKLLWQHNPWQPIGVPTLLRETSVGLEIEGKISATSVGQDALILMRDKVVTDLSIGFDTIRFESIAAPEGSKEEPTRYIDEVKLWEVSPVTWGANAPAQITDVNSLHQGIAELHRQLVGELHEGKVLSAKNKQRLQESISSLETCRAALQIVLDEADKQGRPTPEGQAVTRNIAEWVSTLGTELHAAGLAANTQRNQRLALMDADLRMAELGIPAAA